MRELGQVGCTVQISAVDETARPRVNRGDGVSGRGLALLVHAVVTRHGAVRRLGLHGLAVRAHQHRSHHAQ